MKILVTGGSGFLGRHLVSALGADDLSRRSGRDILDRRDAAIVGEYDVVVHLAANLDKRPDSAEAVFTSNVEGTINLLREMREGSVFIFASTKDVYGRFGDNYAAVPETCPTIYAGQTALEWSKLIAERYVEYYAHARKFRSCIFRLSTVYAPMSEGNSPSFVTAFADAINKGEPMRLPGKGLPIRDVLHVSDLAGACTAFQTSIINHALYNIGGGVGNSYSLQELVKKLEEVSGLQAVIDTESDLPAPSPFKYITDLSLIRQELDWEPVTTAEDGFSSLF